MWCQRPGKHCRTGTVARARQSPPPGPGSPPGAPGSRAGVGHECAPTHIDSGRRLPRLLLMSSMPWMPTLGQWCCPQLVTRDTLNQADTMVCSPSFDTRGSDSSGLSGGSGLQSVGYRKGRSRPLYEDGSVRSEAVGDPHSCHGRSGAAGPDPGWQRSLSTILANGG